MPASLILSRIHAAAGVAAFATIAAFLGSSAMAELSGDPALIADVKQTIAWALLLLVPLLMATGASGFAMVGGRPRGLAGAKLKRMRFIAANGLLVLVPAALYLAWRAGQGALDASFVLVQAVEFAAGAANLALMALNIRDGLAMTKHRRARPERPAGQWPS